MNKFITLIIILFAVFNVTSQTIDKNAVDGCIYFKLKNETEIDFSVKKGKAMIADVPFLKNLIDEYQLTTLNNTFWYTSSPELHRIFRLEFYAKEKINSLIETLNREDVIEYAEKAPYFRISFTPNDPNYSTTGNRWHLDRINASGAWDITHGSSSVKIAVIDNAITINHPDIAPKVFLAIDLADGDSDPSPPSVTTIWSHGTHTSGLACAATNNGIGTASIGFDCSLIAIKAGKDADGGQGVSSMFEGITWAADNGADIISMSFGGPTFFQTMQIIIDYAYNKGCLLVAAAGNNGDGMEDPNNVNYVGYPAACNHVIAVGSTNGNDKKSSFSEFGTWIDVVTPGGYQNDGGLVDIIFNNTVYSTTANTSYGKMSGTSMSCPITAGLCGLMLSVNPGLTPEKIELYLKATCTNIESLQAPEHQGQVGAGRINAQAAVAMASDSISTVYADFTCSGNLINTGGYINFTDLSTGAPVSWSWSFPGGNPASSTDQNPSGIQYNTAGVYDVTLTISDGTNSCTEIKTMFITVQVPANSAWIEQASGFAAMYRGAYQISIVDANTSWVTAIDGTSGYPVNEFTMTTDAGATWTPGQINPATGIAPANISAHSDLKAWVSMYPTTGAGGKVYYTEDAGVTWVNQNNPSMFTNSASFLNIVHFFNENDGYCMGDPISSEFEIYTTADGGTTWNAVPAASIPDAQSGEMGWTGVYDAFGNFTWFGTNKGRIFKSSDKGLTWSALTPGLGDIQKVAFNNENNGIAQQIVYNTSTGAITTFTMKVTNDGGNTWNSVTPGYGTGKSDICGVPNLPGKYFSVGTNGAPYSSATYFSSYSLDYGNTWTVVDSGVQYISVRFLDDFTGWAGGYSLNPTTSGIFKWDANVSVENTDSNENGITIYPNPSDGNVFIKAGKSGEIISICISDISGKTVRQFKFSNNENNNSRIDLTGLQKGVYIVQINSEDNKYFNKLILY